jgi:hypothetical protein
VARDILILQVVQHVAFDRQQGVSKGGKVPHLSFGEDACEVGVVVAAVTFRLAEIVLVVLTNPKLRLLEVRRNDRGPNSDQNPFRRNRGVSNGRIQQSSRTLRC